MKKLALICLIFMILGGAGCGDSNTAPYPKRPIELIVPYSAGGQVDVTARILARHVSKYLPNKQPVIVINKPGAGGTIAMQYIVDSKADGYRLAVTTNGPVTTTPLIQHSTYRSQDINPIMQLTVMPNFICVSNDSPIKTPKDWLEFVLQGNEFRYSMIGIGATQHVTMERLNKLLNIKTIPVPYGGDGEAKTAMMQGSVDGYLTNPINYDPSQYRVIINISNDASSFFPDVPSLKDLGYEIGGYFNILLASQQGVDEQILATINEAFKKTLEDEEVIREFNSVQMEIRYLEATGLRTVIEQTLEEGIPILKNLGLISQNVEEVK